MVVLRPTEDNSLVNQIHDTCNRGMRLGTQDYHGCCSHNQPSPPTLLDNSAINRRCCV